MLQIIIITITFIILIIVVTIELKLWYVEVMQREIVKWKMI